MSKRYRLKKDLPDVKAGAVFIHDGKYSYDYESKNKLPSWYDESNVENNPEWFEEIKEDAPDEISGFQVWYKNGRKSTFITRDEKELFERLEKAINDVKREEIIKKYAAIDRDDLGVKEPERYFHFDKEILEKYPHLPIYNQEQLNKMMEDVKHELKVTEKLLIERQRVLDAIPDCPTHGGNCVPHAIEWIEKQKLASSLK